MRPPGRRPGRAQRGHDHGPDPAGGADDGHPLRCAAGPGSRGGPGRRLRRALWPPPLPAPQSACGLIARLRPCPPTPTRVPTLPLPASLPPAAAPRRRRHRPRHRALPLLPRHVRQGRRHADEQEVRVPGAGGCAGVGRHGEPPRCAARGARGARSRRTRRAGSRGWLVRAHACRMGGGSGGWAPRVEGRAGAGARAGGHRVGAPGCLASPPTHRLPPALTRHAQATPTCVSTWRRASARGPPPPTSAPSWRWT